MISISSDQNGEYSLEAFRQKLDNLTASLENDINLDNLLLEAKSLTPPKQFTPSQLSANESTISFGIDDGAYLEEANPPLLGRYSMSEIGTGASSTSRVPTRSGRVTTAATPEPPTPVKTPLRSDADPRRTTPNPYSSQRGSTSRTDRPSSYVAASNVASSKSNRDHLEDDRQQHVDRLCDTVRRQEERIRALERENDILRSIIYQSPRNQQSIPEPGRYSSNHRSGAWKNRVSPGTQFVAELAQVLVDLPEEQLVPLSRIMDRHLARERLWEEETR